MLIGRGAEQAEIVGLLERARQGQGGALVVRGVAGSGKTALCGYALDQAQGFRSVRVQGVESEATLPFAALHALAQPLRPELHRIPGIQRAALQVATGSALGPPAEPLTIAVATLSLLSTAAAAEPLLMVIDDLQWVDPSSTLALIFVARRLHAERVAMLLASREEPDREQGRANLDGLPLVDLRGLPPG
jgi:predicted ATPase